MSQHLKRESLHNSSLSSFSLYINLNLSPPAPSFTNPSSPLHHRHSSSMEIQEKLLKLKYHIVGVLLFCLAIFSLIHLAPRFLTVLAYFWPLLLSTALFLALVLLFAKTSPSPATDASVTKPAEDLLDYVAGHPEPPLDTHNKSN